VQHDQAPLRLHHLLLLMYDKHDAPPSDSIPDIFYKRLHPDVARPKKATKRSHCYDLFLSPAQPPVVLWPGRQVRVKTGLAFGIAEGWVGKAFPRSGNADKYRVRLGNCTGIIDGDYIGEVELLLEMSYSGIFSPLTITFGHDRAIAQLAFERSEEVNLVETDNLEQTERGAGGFGHTDETKNHG